MEQDTPSSVYHRVPLLISFPVSFPRHRRVKHLPLSSPPGWAGGALSWALCLLPLTGVPRRLLEGLRSFPCEPASSLTACSGTTVPPRMRVSGFPQLYTHVDGVHDVFDGVREGLSNRGTGAFAPVSPLPSLAHLWHPSLVPGEAGGDSRACLSHVVGAGPQSPSESPRARGPRSPALPCPRPCLLPVPVACFASVFDSSA